MPYKNLKTVTSKGKLRKLYILFTAVFVAIFGLLIFHLQLNQVLPFRSFRLVSLKAIGADKKTQSIQKNDHQTQSMNDQNEKVYLSEQFLKDLFQSSQNVKEQDIELRLREKELKTLAEKIELEKSEIEKYIAQIQKWVDKWEQAQQERQSKLIEIISGMPSGQAAQILKDLDDKDVAKILMKINRKLASEIMSQLPNEKTLKITKILLNHGSEIP